MLLSSCIRDPGAATTDVDPRGWSTPAQVLLENSDSLSISELRIIVRAQDDYSPLLLPVELSVLTPDSLATSEQLTLIIASGESSLPYRSGVVLRRTGKYNFTFTPLAEARGITAIGIEIR